MKSLATELLKELNKTETNIIKPMLIQFPELRDLMQKYETEKMDPKEATIKIMEFYEHKYGAIDNEWHPSVLFGMMMV